MYLVDTSVWVDYLNGVATPATDLLDSVIPLPGLVGINAQIYLEILQGARSDTSFSKFKAYFSTQKLYRFADEISSYEAAAQLYFMARKRGLTLRSSLDCLIGQSALEHGLILLHNDRNFLHLAKVAPKLKQKHFLD
jgi:predicted nucleic acid-binding protein